MRTVRPDIDQFIAKCKPDLEARGIDPRRISVWERLLRQGRPFRAWRATYGRPLCLAKLKRKPGHYCMIEDVGRGGRCKWHGGGSTGPRTTEGREAIRQGQQRRWGRYRELKDLGVISKVERTPEQRERMRQAQQRRRQRERDRKTFGLD